MIFKLFSGQALYVFYAIEILESCMLSVGWVTVLPVRRIDLESTHCESGQDPMMERTLFVSTLIEER